MSRMRWELRTVAALALVSLCGTRTPGQDAKRAAEVEEARRAAIARQAAAEDANIAQMEQQFAPQFRQLHRSELHFLRTAADPTRQQYEKIAADGEAAVKAAVREYARAARGLANRNTDPRQALTAAVAKAAKTHLSPEQATRYQTEIDLRAAARRRMIVANLVVMVDAAVMLTADQRRQLTDTLAANWNDTWNQTQYFQYAGRYFPPMPDEKIRPLLTEPQRAVWNGLQKGNISFGFHVQLNGAEIEDEVWADDPPRKGDKPAAKEGKAP